MRPPPSKPAANNNEPQEYPMQKCNEVMTKNPVCCLPNDIVSSVAALMKSRDIGPVLIVDNQQSKKLVGIVTDRDLALKVVAEGRDSKLTRAEEVMTRKIITCRAEDDLQNALDSMAEHKLRRIPVVDNNNVILGIIAQADLATRVDQPEKTGSVVRQISQPN
jgi:CBS domain-containing protein